MGGLRLSLAAKVSAGIVLALCATLAVTVALHQARFRQALLAVTEMRVGLVAGDLAARIQSGLDLGLDLPAMTNVQPILDAEARDDPRIVAVEVRAKDGELLFRGGEAAGAGKDDGAGAASEGRLAEIARSKPRAGQDAAGDQAPEDASRARAGPTAAPVAWLDAGAGLVAARAGLVDIFGDDAGSVVVTYSRASVAATAGEVTGRLARLALVLLALAAGVVLIATRIALRGSGGEARA